MIYTLLAIGFLIDFAIARHVYRVSNLSLAVAYIAIFIPTPVTSSCLTSRCSCIPTSPGSGMRYANRMGWCLHTGIAGAHTHFLHSYCRDSTHTCINIFSILDKKTRGLQKHPPNALIPLLADFPAWRLE
ncbi:hypothetical protein F5Y12DRAFT_192821 [Xylaria sp. FL1777]|nr:hypothetical protein F5Y12DRAFT_192821 [Xylaria sp. FL1777]